MTVKKDILGLTEYITINGKSKKKVKCRIDTGATTSSIDGALAAELHLGPIKKVKNVRSANGVTVRPVIEVSVVIRKKIISGEFTIIERKHMTYPVLIGQNILKKGDFLIDPKK